MKHLWLLVLLQFVLMPDNASAQTVLVKGNPLTKADPNLIQHRFAPGDWQNSASKFVVEGVIYNFYEKSGFAPLNNINGSAFYNQEWKKATIRLKSGKDLPAQEVIYLVSYQLMFWKTTEDDGKIDYKVIDANSIKGVVFEAENDEPSVEFIPGWFDFAGRRYVVYFQLLCDGSEPLVKYHRRKIEYEYEYNNPAGKQSFTPSSEYYFQGIDSVWTLLLPSEFKMQVAATYPALKEQIEQWFQKNSFNARKEKDLLRFFYWLRDQQ